MQVVLESFPFSQIFHLVFAFDAKKHVFQMIVPSESPGSGVMVPTPGKATRVRISAYRKKVSQLMLFVKMRIILKVTEPEKTSRLATKNLRRWLLKDFRHSRKKKKGQKNEISFFWSKVDFVSSVSKFE